MGFNDRDLRGCGVRLARAGLETTGSSDDVGLRSCRLPSARAAPEPTQRDVPLRVSLWPLPPLAACPDISAPACERRYDEAHCDHVARCGSISGDTMSFPECLAIVEPLDRLDRECFVDGLTAHRCFAAWRQRSCRQIPIRRIRSCADAMAPCALEAPPP